MGASDRNPSSNKRVINKCTITQANGCSHLGRVVDGDSLDDVDDPSQDVCEVRAVNRELL